MISKIDFSFWKMIPLSEVKVGQRVLVHSMDVDEPVNQRLLAFGLTPGAEVRIVHVAPLGDPIAISFCSQKVMIRRSDAARVMVEDVN
jgi:ferrous iron transport protein A